MKPGEDLQEEVIAQIGPIIRELTRNMKDPVVEMREWPYDYTREEAVARFLAEDLDTDRL